MGTRRLSAPWALLPRLAGLVAVGVVAVGVVAGCSGQPRSAASARPTASPLAGPSDRSVSSPSPVATSGGPSPSRLTLPTGPAQPPPATRPGSPAPPGGQQTLTGQVEEGVERGCLVLRDPTGLYQLLGGDPAIVRVGATVSVTGHLATGVKSFCMQGRPFQVTGAHRN